MTKFSKNVHDRDAEPPLEGGAGGRLDRERVAKFVGERRQAIRNLARTKIAQSFRGLFDSEDVYSSVAKAVDQMAASGRLQPSGEHELWALIAAITSNNAVSKVRLASRARSLVAEDGEYARVLQARAERCEGDGGAAVLCLELMASLKNSEDRILFALRLRGASHRVAAEVLGINEISCRQRWKAITDRLAEAFKGHLDG